MTDIVRIVQQLLWTIWNVWKKFLGLVKNTGQIYAIYVIEILKFINQVTATDPIYFFFPASNLLDLIYFYNNSHVPMNQGQ